MPVPDFQSLMLPVLRAWPAGRAPPSVTPVQGSMHPHTFRTTSRAPPAAFALKWRPGPGEVPPLPLPWDGGTERTCGRCCRVGSRTA